MIECIIKQMNVGDIMPQSCYDVIITDKDTAKDLVTKASTVAGVKWVNVNIDNGTVVVTHSHAYNEAAFKAAVGI